MADGRQRAEWGRGASLAAHLLGAWVGRPIDPADLVPDRYRPDREPPPPRSAADEAAENEIAWRLLGAGLAKG